jgi:DNA (cytosine-5)-methyltransferase 1
MSKIRVLNLYAGIGGNRKLWDNVEVTAIEINPKIASVYQRFFPNDKVIVTDAHSFLIRHYEEFDFIWSSPPCPTHSRYNLCLDRKKYPDMKLYEEIIFLSWFFKGRFVVENVKSYYKPMIKPYILDGHYFWSNFPITIKNGGAKPNDSDISTPKLAVVTKIDLAMLGDFSNKEQRTILRNYIMPETGLKIFKAAFSDRQKVLKGDYV